MTTKFEHLMSTLEEKELHVLASLIQTKVMGGNMDHQHYFDQYIKVKKLTHSKRSVKERLILSDLYKMAEKYVVIKASLASTHHVSQVLLKHFREHEDDKLFHEYQQQAEKKSLHIKEKNGDYFRHIENLKYEKWNYDQLKNRFSNTEADEIIHFGEIAIISNKLQQAVSLMPQSTMISKQISSQFIEHIEPYILEQNFLKYACIAIYYYAFKMLTRPNEGIWFVNYQESLNENKSNFSHEELRTLYLQAINYCIRKHNSGDKSFSELLLHYYIIALKEQHLLTNGFLSKNTYRNINTIAIRMGRFDVALEISTNNADKLRKEEKESAYRFNMANIYYARQQYDEALDALRYAEFDDHLSNLFAKTLLLKIYYELKAERLLEAHLDAMQVYLTRKKIIGYHKSNYLNIVKFTRKLLRVNPYDRYAKEKLIAQVKNEKMLPDRDWLLKQLEV